MLRDDDYKYVHFAGMPPLLYDLRNDPMETHDLAGRSAEIAAAVGWEREETNR